jgi:hypothetical protein
MVKYESRFERLAFYANGERKRFVAGTYETNDKTEITVLDGLVDATRVDAPKESVSKTDAKSDKTETKTEETVPKPKPTRKSSAK